MSMTLSAGSLFHALMISIKIPLSSYWYQLLPQSNYMLIDIADKMLEVSKKRVANLDNVYHLVLDYTNELPSPSKMLLDSNSRHFDTMNSALSIHHLQDEAKAKQKNSEITEDELKQAEDEIQKITDKYIDEIDSLISEFCGDKNIYKMKLIYDVITLINNYLKNECQKLI